MARKGRKGRYVEEGEISGGGEKPGGMMKGKEGKSGIKEEGRNDRNEDEKGRKERRAEKMNSEEEKIVKPTKDASFASLLFLLLFFSPLSGTLDPSFMTETRPFVYLLFVRDQ